MEGSIEKRNQSNGIKDKLNFLKDNVEKHGDFIPDSIEGPLKESIDMAEKAIYAESVLKEITEFLDVDIDVMDNLDHLLEVLNTLKDFATWLEGSSAGEYITRAAAEVVALIAQFEAMADKLKVVGIESKEGAEIAKEMKAILQKIIRQLDKAIEAIEFVKILQGTEMNWDGVKKMMKHIETKID
jgi:hypothetical protein